MNIPPLNFTRRFFPLAILCLLSPQFLLAEPAAPAAIFKKLPTEGWSKVIPADKKLSPAWEKSLFERGAPRTYQGEALMNIGMPVGGVCAGFVNLGGDGKLWWWDIFNRKLDGVQPRQIQYKGRSWHGLPAGLGAWQGGNYVEPVKTQPSPFQQGFVLQWTAGGKTGIRTMDRKGWKNIVFTGSYPVGKVEYSDPDCPVKVTLEAYSPYCPLNFDDSSYPAIVMRYRLENTGADEVKASVGGWLENPVLIDTAKEAPDMRRTNSVTTENGMTLLTCAATATAMTDRADWGSMAMAAIGGSASRGWAQLTDFSGQLVFEANGPAKADSPPDKPLLGGVSHDLTIAPGKGGTAAFVISWHFVNVKESATGSQTGLYYGKRFPDAAAVARHIAANEKRLSDTTLFWRDTWHDSTLPYWFLERTFNSLNCLASTTCFRFADGRFYTYEGVRSCAGHPDHVWHYAQGHARIFPELEQDVLERVWYGFAYHEDGSHGHRGENGPAVAIDGHCGVILAVLRAHQMNPDAAMLKRLWPRVKKSVEFAITRDRDKDGLLDTPMLTTLDEPWYGQIPWISGLYVAALRAGEQMANEMGDVEFAQHCGELAAKGRAAMDAKLFNGEWFVQTPDPANPQKLGAYETCHIDQVLGQAWAWQVGLGRVLNEDTTRSALRSVWKYNFSRNLDAYDKQSDPKGRPYFTDGEGGLVMTSNALGRKTPFGVYSGFACYLNETMNGFEYQAAAHMIAEGMVKEGLAVIRTIDDRYDGNKRNPFDEVECGDHYARSMASFGALIAISGFKYHGPLGAIGFDPRITPEHFKAPFITAEGWGSYQQKFVISNLKSEIQNSKPKISHFKSTLTVKYGQLRVRTISLGLPEGFKPERAKVSMADKAFGSKLELVDGKAVLTLVADVIIPDCASLVIMLE